MSTELKIKDVRAKMMNVSLQGSVRRKMPQIAAARNNPNQKYFSFYLVDRDSELRLSAYNQSADKHFPHIKPDKFLQITNISIKESTFQGAVQLQGTLQLDSVITEIEATECVSRVFVPINDVSNKHGQVDVLGLVVRVQENVERILKSGEEKMVKVVTMKDRTAQITITFWAQQEKEISENDILELEGATINEYKGAHSLNVNSFTIVSVNPERQEAIDLKAALMDSQSQEVIFNLSQTSQSTAATHLDPDIPVDVIIAEIEKDLQAVQEQENGLRIKKMRLSAELEHYKCLQ